MAELIQFELTGDLIKVSRPSKASDYLIIPDPMRDWLPAATRAMCVSRGGTRPPEEGLEGTSTARPSA